MTERKYLLFFCTFFLLFASYSFFVYTDGTAVNASITMSDDAKQGRHLWQKHNCISCHQLYGMGGYIGPDLTNVISAEGKGEPLARAMIQYGTDVMPNYHLNEEEINALVEFLKYADKTGTFPGRNVEITWYGSFKIK